ncbi:hypothetical protein TSAR_014390 [Trichomalopsis sarcophagae]|uniref:Uncharacterized protein n=1 Tax=Trichomalopsis sarcophagae TaxID=543379 RepID=A0A232EQL1_9HYME|nr:hypothetical protein TSAR_014390 [Trichomalopsis sarcophagae]
MEEKEHGELRLEKGKEQVHAKHTFFIRKPTNEQKPQIFYRLREHFYLRDKMIIRLLTTRQTLFPPVQSSRILSICTSSRSDFVSLTRVWKILQRDAQITRRLCTTEHSTFKNDNFQTKMTVIVLVHSIFNRRNSHLRLSHPKFSSS